MMAMCRAARFAIFLTGTALATLPAASSRADPDRNEATLALVEAYPDFFVSSEDGVRWRDGTAVYWSAPRQFDKVPANPIAATLSEQFLYRYPLDPWNGARLPDEDPGRLRDTGLFAKMYGDCRRMKIAPHLRMVTWLPKLAPQRVQVTTVNGVDKALEALSAEIEALPPPIGRLVARLSGSFSCRLIRGTDQLSMHAYGAAIDLQMSAGRYWKWSGMTPDARRTHRVPLEIIELFEKHGFIWGGKWYHVDSIHFEYRPELIAYARRLRRAVPVVHDEMPL